MIAFRWLGRRYGGKAWEWHAAPGRWIDLTWRLRHPDAYNAYTAEIEAARHDAVERACEP